MNTSTNIYTLDKQDRISALNGGWDEFANKNGGKNLSSQDICGRKIWDFVTGDATRMWLEALFQLTRLRGTSIERPYRCDSPNLKRFMRMRIDEQGGNLRVEHEILSTEQRVAPVHIRYGAHVKKRNRHLCSICGRLNDGYWQEPCPEHAEVPEGILVIYTVCEDCRSRFTLNQGDPSNGCSAVQNARNDS
jgi:hypothetical protein